jgi:hypothetical protein
LLPACRGFTKARARTAMVTDPRPPAMESRPGIIAPGGAGGASKIVGLELVSGPLRVLVEEWRASLR